MIHNFDVNSNGLLSGDYTGYVKITSNGGSASIPINLIVESNSEVILGDLNDDGTLNVQDIVLMVNIILNGGWADSADLSSDGNIDVLDVIQLINLILA